MSNTNISAADGKSEARKRLFWLDVARALAIISITFNHAASRSYATHEGTFVEFTHMSYMGSFTKAFLYVFSRIGVPLFLMISGSLLLERDYERQEVLNRFYTHNIWRLLRTTIIWLFIMYWYLSLFGGSILRTEGFVRALFKCLETLLFVNQITMGSMWYMPMIIAFYLMIPIFSVALKRLGDKPFIIPMIIALISGMIVPNMNVVLQALGSTKTINYAFSIYDIFSIYFIYVMMGYWIKNGKLSSINGIVLTIAFVLFFMMTVAFQFWIYSSPTSDYFVRYADLGIVLSTSCLFEIIRRKGNIFQRYKKQILYLSKISFGIYFVHICVMTGLQAVLNKLTTINHLPRFMILEIAAFSLSVLIIHLTSRVKWIKNYLYMIK